MQKQIARVTPSEQLRIVYHLFKTVSEDHDVTIPADFLSLGYGCATFEAVPVFHTEEGERGREREREGERGGEREFR